MNVWHWPTTSDLQPTAEPVPVDVRAAADVPEPTLPEILPVARVISADRHGESSEPTVRDRRGLIATAPVKLAWILCQVAAVPLGWFSVSSGLVACVGALLLLALWSGIAAVNARRARPRTVYTRPPGALRAAGSWFAPAAVVTIAGVVTLWLEDRTAFADDLTGDDRRWRIAWIVGTVAAVPFVLSTYLPYSVMGRVTNWAGGARRRWQHMYVLPILATILAVLMQLPLLLSIGEDANDGALGALGTLSTGLWVLLAVLPLVLLLWLGARAMTETERASRMTWERRNFPAESIVLSSEMAARTAANRYLEVRPNG